jgi:UDP-4-amino-4,6-dideoxy-N-acetyl-beta-L-altrosamine transaminase
MKAIPYGRQDIIQSDIDAVIDVLQSDYLTQGPAVKLFEEEFSKYVDSPFSIAVSNGTSALHLSALALGVQPGDKVITTPITFAASANCIRYCGAEILFADIDPETYLIDFDSIKTILESEPKGSVKGLVLVDFAGKSIDGEKFNLLAKEYNLWIIEDACHAPGAYYLDSYNKKVKSGSSIYSDITIFSFHPVKHIATGEGGMITTRNKNLFTKIVKLRTHGITRESSEFKNSIQLAGGISTYPLWYMEMQELGYNYRITDFQAALGISQLKRAEFGIERRHEIVKRYDEAFTNCKFIYQKPAVDVSHAYHLYIIEVENRLGLYNYLRENQIFAQVHYFPCHLMPYYQELGWKEGDFEHAEHYYKNCISLPIFPALNPIDQEYIIKKVFEFYETSMNFNNYIF